jgi:hypothetical protein
MRACHEIDSSCRFNKTRRDEQTSELHDDREIKRAAADGGNPYSAHGGDGRRAGIHVRNPNPTPAPKVAHSFPVADASALETGLP